MLINDSSNEKKIHVGLKEIIKQIHSLKRFYGTLRMCWSRIPRLLNSWLRESPHKSRTLRMKSLNKLHLIPRGVPACSHPLLYSISPPELNAQLNADFIHNDSPTLWGRA